MRTWTGQGVPRTDQVTQGVLGMSGGIRAAPGAGSPGAARERSRRALQERRRAAPSPAAPLPEAAEGPLHGCGGPGKCATTAITVPLACWLRRTPAETTAI